MESYFVCHRTGVQEAVMAETTDYPNEVDVDCLLTTISAAASGRGEAAADGVWGFGSLRRRSLNYISSADSYHISLAGRRIAIVKAFLALYTKDGSSEDENWALAAGR